MIHLFDTDLLEKWLRDNFGIFQHKKRRYQRWKIFTAEGNFWVRIRIKKDELRVMTIIEEEGGNSLIDEVNFYPADFQNTDDLLNMLKDFIPVDTRAKDRNDKIDTILSD